MTLQDTLKPLMVPIHREGWPFITLFGVITLIATLFGGETLFWIGALLTGWCTYFFRNPDRITPTRPGLLISPADGVVQMIRKVDPPPELEYAGPPTVRISIFMNVFDVHVNRVPIAGRVTKLHYRPGKFLNASMDKASVDNERQSVLMETEDGEQVAFVQIAGLVARRILCDLEPAQDIETGERFGMIRFGSRVDVYLPERCAPLVVEGQRAVAGETVLANMADKRKKQQAMKGEKR
ncbi:MAG: phosphatidylserine decarboxylase [Alphaproteobacteria bacterium]|nr:phosphatidylserine decarboxylase [Alphaproteobacteria bacterium]